MLPVEAARDATDVLEEARVGAGLSGPAVARHRLHITLIHVGDYLGTLPPSVVEASKRAAESAVAPSFDIILDRVGSFAGAPGRHPYVLLESAKDSPLRRLRENLLTAVAGAGVKPLSPSTFVPHVTLTYGDRRLAERTIRPIRWTAEEMVLIHSEVGRSIYHTLGRWTLGTVRSQAEAPAS